MCVSFFAIRAFVKVKVVEMLLLCWQLFWEY